MPISIFRIPKKKCCNKYPVSIRNMPQLSTNQRCFTKQDTLEEDVQALISANPEAKIFIDTCTLLHSCGKELLHALVSYDANIYIFDSVFHELKKNGAEEMLEFLKSLELNGKIKTPIGASSDFSDINFIARFAAEIQNCDLILISQDYDLGLTIDRLKDFIYPAVKSPYSIEVKHLGNNCLKSITNNNFINQKEVF